MANDSDKSNATDEAAEFFKAGAQASGGLLGGLTALLGKVGELADKGKELRESGQFEQGDKTARYGVSVKMGLGDGPGGGGQPSVAPVNDSARRQRQASTARVREPEVDVFDEDGALVLVVELPGINDDGVTLESIDGGLRLHAANDQYRFEKSLKVEDAVRVETAEISSNNGVFEIRLRRD